MTYWKRILLLSVLVISCIIQHVSGFAISKPAFTRIRQSPCLDDSHCCQGQRERHPRQRGTRTRTCTSLFAATTNEGTLSVSRPDGNEYKLAYRIVRPMTLSSRQAAPVVVLHGGPSLPADYLYPLEQAVEYRSLVFYDQIGCGRSDEPTDTVCYSIDMALDDLEALLKKLGVRRFHLYGQSFGGMLAYEYLKRRAERHFLYGNDTEPVCLSCILSSAPSSVKRIEETVDRLLDGLTLDDPAAFERSISLQERFRMTHQCRTPVSPQPLLDAYARAGTVWRGTDAVRSWEATPAAATTSAAEAGGGGEGTAASFMPSILMLRGEHDFVTEDCFSSWKDVLRGAKVRFRVLQGCSHHGLLENGSMYGEVLDSFFSEFD